jgi:hypothetical protein
MYIGGSGGGKVYRVNTTSGAQMRPMGLGSTQACAAVKGLAGANNFMIATCPNGSVVTLRPDGLELWDSATGSAISAGPAIVDGAI